MRQRILAGDPPTLREVQEALEIRAIRTVQVHLSKLVSEGQLRKLGTQSRGYRLPLASKRNQPTRFVPILGQVQAGELTTAIENAEDHIAIQSRHATEELFALTVRGDSMKGAGILEGDLVIVRRQPTAESGDIIVALVEDEATVKRLKHCRDSIELCPENPDFEPIIPDPSKLKILGKVIELRRDFEATTSNGGG